MSFSCFRLALRHKESKGKDGHSLNCFLLPFGGECVYLNLQIGCMKECSNTKITNLYVCLGKKISIATVA